MHAKRLILAATLLASSAHGVAVAAPEQIFEARTTTQLLDACTVPPDDPAHGLAMQFCRGFALGVLSRQSQGCALPGDWPHTITGYAAWAHANPIHLDDNPGKSLIEFLDLHGRCRG